ncbi:MAG: CBS domain-containing protein [Planctomycetota bacterium]|nr:MAG: CBS domain-containing protein [Planctomycetota bacterium]
MLIREIMSQNVVCIPPDSPLAEAASQMRTMNVGSLPVCENDRLVGIVTDRDITVRATAECCDPNETTVRDVMTPTIVYAFDDQPVEAASQLMKEHQIRRIAVLNRDKRLVGIVALGDIAIDAPEELTGETLEAISEPAISGT